MAWFQHGGSKIYYEIAGEGATVLLLPGFSDRIEAHVRLRDILTHTYRVIAADLPGSGQSLPQPRSYHPRYWHDDAEAFIALLRSLDVGEAHLLGYSDGGEVALLMAALAPGMARSALTWGAAGFVDDPEGRISAIFRHVMDGTVPQLASYREYLRENYGEAIARAMTRSEADALDAVVAAGGDISRSLTDRIACRLLMLCGEKDPMVSKPLIDVYVSRVLGAESVVFDGAAHALHSERPELFDATVTAWLARN